MQQTWLENGQKLTENNYTNDVFNGTQQEWYKNGNLKSEENYLNGVPDSYHTYYNSNNNKQKEVLYNNGEIIKTTDWNNNGTIKSSFEYINGKIKDGEYIFTDDNGKKINKQTYLNGNKIEEFIFRGEEKNGKLIKWHNNNILKFECEYTNGMINGEFKLYDEKGQLISNGNYSNGLKEGKFSFYNDGNLISDEYYKNDKPEGEINWYYKDGNNMFQNNQTENNLKYKFWNSNNEIIYEH